jgi:hypothetical protein
MPTGSKLWKYRYRIEGKAGEFLLGAYGDKKQNLSLADAMTMVGCEHYSLNKVQSKSMIYGIKKDLAKIPNSINWFLLGLLER